MPTVLIFIAIACGTASGTCDVVPKAFVSPSDCYAFTVQATELLPPPETPGAPKALTFVCMPIKLTAPGR